MQKINRKGYTALYSLLGITSHNLKRKSQISTTNDTWLRENINKRVGFSKFTPHALAFIRKTEISHLMIYFGHCQFQINRSQ